MTKQVIPQEAIEVNASIRHANICPPLSVLTKGIMKSIRPQAVKPITEIQTG